MFYPYLRGKQFELILVRDNAQFLADNRIHPIIEPVKEDFTSLIRAMEALNEKNTPYTLIVNPKAGQSPIDSLTINALIDDTFSESRNFSIGYILTAESNINPLIEMLRKHPERNFSLIHFGFTEGQKLAEEIISYENINRHIFIDGYAGKLYQKHLKKIGIERVLIRNGFKAQKKNALYPPNEHFSDLHITYTEENMDGFGDFLIVGDDYTETGGPARAITIHLTYLQKDHDMFIFHFVSDRTDSPTDHGGKFFEALTKLVREFKKPNSLIFKSKAIEEFCKFYVSQHFPGLGFVKKLSMQHHLELMASYLNRSA